MEVHRQRCQHCGSLEHYNLLRRREGQSQTVFVACARCHGLVAVYRLSDYYHHGKGFASWVATRRPGESARALRETFEQARDEAELGFQEALDVLAEEGKELS